MINQSDLLPFTREEYRLFSGLIFKCRKCCFRYFSERVEDRCPNCGFDVMHLELCEP
jgi:predicted Zn-ribbon and HTH transcriptional regulator